jgi:tRNA-binding protein
VEARPDIPVEAFAAVDMRVGEVREVLPFPEARKPAWRIRVDFGPALGERWTSAQVTNYAPDELLGRRVIGCVNLGVRRIAGFESQFLLLGSIQADGTVLLLDADPAAELGAPVA